MVLGTVANLDAMDNVVPIESEPQAMDAIVLPPEPKSLSSSEKAVVDRPQGPQDSPFPTDTRAVGNKLIHPKATFPLAEPNGDESADKYEPAKLPQPEPEPQLESQPKLSAGDNSGSNVESNVKTQDETPHVVPPKNEEIVVERVPPQKAVETAGDLISKDAIAKEDAEMADAKEKPKQPKEEAESDLKDLAKQIKNNQESIMDTMSMLQQKIEKISDAQNANAENLNGPNSNSINSNVEKPNVQNQGAEPMAPGQSASNVHSSNQSNGERSNGDVRNAPIMAVPIPELLVSGDVKHLRSSEAKQPAIQPVVNPAPVAVEAAVIEAAAAEAKAAEEKAAEEKRAEEKRAEEKAAEEKAPILAGDNNVVGRDLLSEKTQAVEAEKGDNTHNL